MKRFNSGRNFAALILVWTMLATPLAMIAQTRIVAPKNKYKVQDDIKLGRDYSAKVEQEMPILRDAESTAYLESVGPGDISGCALPGGPMYGNRGMIEAAKTEGEMAGVMAHEISHVALRHSTAQATQQSNPLKQILGIGAILGGAIVLGETGAAIGQTLYNGLLVYPYSREYETQADMLGA